MGIPTLEAQREARPRFERDMRVEEHIDRERVVRRPADVCPVRDELRGP